MLFDQSEAKHSGAEMLQFRRGLTIDKIVAFDFPVITAVQVCMPGGGMPYVLYAVSPSNHATGRDCQDRIEEVKMD